MKSSLLNQLKLNVSLYNNKILKSLIYINSAQVYGMGWYCFLYILYTLQQGRRTALRLNYPAPAKVLGFNCLICLLYCCLEQTQQ